MPIEQNIIARDKASRHIRQPNAIYQGVVTSVKDDGRVHVRIPSLQLSLGPVLPVNTTPLNVCSKGDTVICTFTNNENTSLIVLGLATKKDDVFASIETGVSRFPSASARSENIPSPSEGRIVYLLDSDELQIYNGAEWITVIDTANSENITASTLVATSASIGTLTVTGASTLNVLGASNLSASTTIGTITPTELSYLDGTTSAIQTQINAKAPLANPTLTSPTLTGIPVAPTATAGTNTTQLATTAFVTTADNLKAPLASPTFTGIPTAPTAIAGTITTQLATTAFVTTADNLKAPSASPTFTGLVTLPSTTSIGTVSSTELGYIDGVTSAIQTQIDTKSPLASPTFTGIPAAPTAVAGTSTTQLATTAFVTTADNLKAPLASPTFTGTPSAPTASAGTSTTQIATTAFVGAAVSVGMPTGSIVPFAGSAAPTGWLLCDGGSTGVLRATYANLFAVIGTTYGPGDGSTTFNVPDLRGRVVAGVDNMGGVSANRITSAISGIAGTTLAATGGSQSLTSHNHTQNSHNHTQDSHNHTQDSHNHTQNAHAHSNSLTGTTTFAADGHTHAGQGSLHAAIGATNADANRIGYVAGGVYSGPFSTYSISGSNRLDGQQFNHNTPVYGSTGGNSANAAVGLSNANATATNVASTAINQATTAVNQSTTAVNVATGAGASENVQPTIILNYIIKV